MENLYLSKFKLEHTECDFKREVEHKKTKSWLKSVCAFANGIGGALIFGIDDENRQYCPISDLQDEIEFITDCIKDRISPIPEFILEPDTVDGNTVLVLKVSGGLNTPYYLNENSTKITFIRAGSSSVQADTPILHELILKGTNRTWDTLKSEYEAKDFSFTYFESLYFNITGKRIEEKDYLSFGLKTKDGYLTNAGALFTDVCPFRHSRIFCTRWNGLTKAPSSFDAIDDKEYSGSILKLLNDGESFIKLYNQKIWYKLPTTRVEKENFPERAIHEAMVNALVHRDYGVLGSEIHIDIFDDRIVIQNPGGMYDGIPVQNQNLEDVVSTRRNPVIADLLTRMDFMERRGSGFRKIMDAVKFAPNYTDANLPIFNSNPYSFSVTFKNMNYGINPIEGQKEQLPEDFPKTSQRLLKDSANGGIATDPKSGLKTIKWPKKWPKKWPEKCQIIYDAIRENQNITIPELETLCNIGHTTIKKMLAEMQNEGLIKHEGATNGGYWTITLGDNNGN